MPRRRRRYYIFEFPWTIWQYAVISIVISLSVALVTFLALTAIDIMAGAGH